jgi:sporulation protein YlmC with PRC-barrel domain
MRLSDLRGMHVVSSEGERLGRVHEVHCDREKIVAILRGAANLVERWTGRSHGRRVDWSSIDRIESGSVVLKPKPSARKRR